MDVPDDGNSPAYIQRAFSFMTQCQSLITMLGPAASMFRDVFYPKWPRPGHITAMVGTLLGIKSSIEHGFLNRVENLILADAFSDLLGQAQHLFEKQYFLAAGILGRAVLESHLRKWCERAGCLPQKDKATLDDYKSELYRANHLGKTEMKHVEGMTAIGNDAAHANPSLTLEQVERLLEGLTEFLANHPLP